MARNPYTLDNDVFSAFLFYASLLVMKMLLMTILTTVKRFRNKAVRSSEDLYRVGNDPAVRKKALLPNEEVERVRRCHRNDLENVYVFILAALLYIASDPSLTTALLYFRVYTISRYCHSVVYVNAIPQPARAISFTIGYFICWIMAISTLLSFL